ncbi:metallopeptidase TldD-related protein, partial [Enterococcus faecium]
ITRGLLVTRFWYCRWLDRKELMVTGLTRDGVFLVENGAITRPVNNFRFNDSPARMLANVLGMTASTVRVPEWDGVVRMPAVAARAFNMAS